MARLLPDITDYYPIRASLRPLPETGVHTLDRIPSTSRAPQRKRRFVSFGLLALFFIPAILLASASAPQRTDARTVNVNGAPGAAPASSQQYGFVMALLDNDDNAAAMGFGWVQYGVYWKDAEPSPGSYNWGDVDNIIHYA